MSVSGRPVALRALASQLGFLVRRSRRLFPASSDLVRFLFPITEVLADIGDELHHLRRVHAADAAPPHVASSIHLLRAISVRSARVAPSAPVANTDSDIQPSIPIAISLVEALGITIDAHADSFGVGTMVDYGYTCIRCGVWQPFHSSSLPIHSSSLPSWPSADVVSTDPLTSSSDIIGAWEPLPVPILYRSTLRRRQLCSKCKMQCILAILGQLLMVPAVASPRR